jgi:hypothetical protein
VIPPTIRVVNIEPDPSPAAHPKPSFKLRLSTALLASSLVLALGGGAALEAYRWGGRSTQATQAPDPTMLALSRLQDDLGRLKTSVDSARPDDTVRALKKSVDVLKAEFDGLKTNNAAAMAQLNAKLDKPGRDPAPNLAEIMARIDKLDHDPKLTDIAARLDRIERQVSSPTPTGSINAPARPAPQSVVSQAVSTPLQAAKPLPKPVTLDNWIVRDVYSGIALVEGRAGGVREVAPGEFLPGAGEVRSIERRGRAWIVVTSRGIIDNETW